MILLIETSTLNCSVALGQPDGTLLDARAESSGQYLHAERLHVLIDDLFSSSRQHPKQLTAVAVGRGPGSFTGLRIGVSTAKGICTGLNLPLLAPCPLKALRHQGIKAHPSFAEQPERVIPAMDARRMELYTFDEIGKPVAAIVDSGFRSDLSAGPALLIGDGAEKCQEALAGHPAQWRFLQAHPTAADLLPEAAALWAAGTIENVADFEPFYLKDFIPGKPKDPLGLRASNT